METTTVRRVYRFRLEPNSSQEEGFRRYAGARRFIWNWALHQKRDHYQTTGKGLSEKELSARLTVLKGEPDTAWLKEIDSQLLQQVLADLKRAFANFFDRRAHFPRFRSRKRDTARFRIPQRVTLTDGSLTVPKIGRVKVRQSQEVEGVTKSATFKRDACGHWFVSLVAEMEIPAIGLALPAAERVVGVDLGLKDAVVTSDGERVAAPRFYRAAQRKLRRAQRGQSRKQKGSKNRRKARVRVARVHQKIAAKRNDFCHKLTTRLVKEHDAVCIEDLNVKGLAKTKLATSILDASMGTIRRQLQYKGAWYGVHVVAVGRFYPSSRLCHDCGYKHDRLTLSDREWACPSCGSIVDRDLNAARNIKQEGLRILAAGHADSLNACGQGVRPAMPAALAIPA
jgi:putative transposase